MLENVIFRIPSTITHDAAGEGTLHMPQSREEYVRWCREFGEAMRAQWRPNIRICRGPDVKHRHQGEHGFIEYKAPGPPIGMAFVASQGTTLVWGASACHHKDAKLHNNHVGLVEAYKHRHAAELETILQIANRRTIEAAAAAIQLMVRPPHERVVGTLVGMLCQQINIMREAVQPVPAENG